MNDLLNRKEALLKEQDELARRKREITKELGKIEEEILYGQESACTKVGRYFKNSWSEDLLKIISYKGDGQYEYLAVHYHLYDNGTWESYFEEGKVDAWDLSQQGSYTEISEEEFISTLRDAVNHISPLSNAVVFYDMEAKSKAAENKEETK